jgi:NAD(P)-dependent dehydrogenase (short-subunit alcohol dehydrogenase family)
MAEPGRLSGRVALITGASRGIGAAVAKRFGREGAHLVLCARTVGGLEEVDDAVQTAGGERATLVPLDLADGDAIDQMGAALYERFGRLDILIGNAGTLGDFTPIGHAEPAMWEETLRINTTANFRLIRSMDPLLRASEAGRAVFVTSSAARNRNAFTAPYAASKAALEALVQIYAEEVAHTAVRANIVDPGGQRTRMYAKAFPGADPDTIPDPETMTGVFVDLSEASCEKNGEIIRAYPD